MQFKDIDELIKRGIDESEAKNEFHLLQAKSRIWDSIELPKRKNTVHWGFAISLAACLTLFIISTLLFLKLESQKEELAALQAYVKEEKAHLEEPTTIAIIEPKPPVEKVEEQQLNPIPVNVSQTNTPSTNRLSLHTELEEESGDADNADIVQIGDVEMIAATSQLDIDIPEITFNPVTTELHIPDEMIEKTISETKPKTQGKFRFRFGANSNAIDQQNTLSLNIKL